MASKATRQIEARRAAFRQWQATQADLAHFAAELGAFLHLVDASVEGPAEPVIFEDAAIRARWAGDHYAAAVRA